MDVPAELKELSATLASIEAVVDVGKLRAEVAELEQEASAPDLWNDTDNAQRVTSRLSNVQGEIRRVEDLRSRFDDAQTLWELAEEADDADSRVPRPRPRSSGCARPSTSSRCARCCPASTTSARRW